MPKLLLLIPMLSTALGGLLALRFRKYADLLIALGAGLLLGATFLDLLPEALGLGVQFGFSLANLLGLLLFCFLAFYAVDVAIASLEKRPSTKERGWLVNRMAAVMFIFHSSARI